MNQNEYFKMKVMRRVYFLYYAKKFLQPTSLQIAGLVSLVAVEAFFVSLKNVFINASGVGFSNMFSYFISAFLHTELSIKIVTIALLLVALLLAYRPAKSLGRSVGSGVFSVFGFRAS